MFRSLRLAAIPFAGFVLASNATAQFTLSEIYVNAPGADQTQEGVEIRGAASAALTGYWFLTIDGDGTSAGVVDQAIDLNALSTGSNGLLLVRDDASTILPGPDPATSVHVHDFAPDLENGSNTYVIGTGTAPTVGTDLDLDGILDAGTIVGFTVVDSVTIIESDGASNFAYADDLGGFVFPQFTWTPDAVYRIYDGAGTPTGWSGGDVVGSIGGPYSWAVPTEIYQLVSCGLDLGQINVNVPDFDGDGTPNTCDDVTTYCFGDTGNCPCGNIGAVGNGCPSSVNPNGGNLAATGVASVGADTLVLTGTGMPNSSALYFQGVNSVAGGAGAAFGDGLRCATGSVWRLGTKTNAGGASQYPVGGDASISVKGHVTTAGSRTYQVWYRNPAPFCTASTFNLTNGWRTVWGP